MPKQIVFRERCAHCGYEGLMGKEIVDRQYYLGGQGYVWRTECRDTRACEARWEAANLARAYTEDTGEEQATYSMAHPSGGRIW